MFSMLGLYTNIQQFKFSSTITTLCNVKHIVTVDVIPLTHLHLYDAMLCSVDIHTKRPVFIT